MRKGTGQPPPGQRQRPSSWPRSGRAGCLAWQRLAVFGLEARSGRELAHKASMACALARIAAATGPLRAGFVLAQGADRYSPPPFWRGGRVVEGAAWNACRRETVSGVRIPPSPPLPRFERVSHCLPTSLIASFPLDTQEFIDSEPCFPTFPDTSWHHHSLGGSFGGRGWRHALCIG